jgi:hypothetical protein
MITRLMPLVLAAITENEELKLGLKAVHFLGTQQGEPENHVVTLIYERPIPPHWTDQAIHIPAVRLSPLQSPMQS